METFNHIAPISVRALQFLGNVTDAQVKECRAQDLKFPPMRALDPDKCGETSSEMWQKAIKQQEKLDLRNLRKIWSVGRPYLKCKCKKERNKDYGDTPLWFDHVLWYLLAHPEILFLDMSSIKIRTSMLIHYLRTTWRDGVLAAISFHFLRDLMMGYVKELEGDATLTAETILKEDRLWNYPIPATLARIMLPTRGPSSSINAPGHVTTLPTGRRSWEKQKSECDGFLHLRYTSRITEPLPIKRLLNEVLARLVGDETATWLESTRIGWTYNGSIASWRCRPTEVFCDFNVAQWMEAYDPRQCPCRSRRYADMQSNSSIELLQNEGCTHVITLDSSMTDNPLLQGIINSGLSHIPCIALDVDEAEGEVDNFLDKLFATGELSAIPALPIAPATLLYLMMVFKAHKGTFRWIMNTANTVVSPAADLCACLLRFLLPLVQTFCQERSLEVEEQYGVRPNLWWAIAVVGEFCANLPEKVFSVFTADITRCFETIPIDNSEDSLPAAVRFYVQSAMRVRRERSSSHAIGVKVGVNGNLWPSWVDGDQPEGMGSIMFREEDICWLTKWCIANNVLRMGDYVWGQVKGIPMGLACSPIWCDIYFFKYEYHAMMRSADTGNVHLISCFADTFMYIDDLGSISNAIIRDFVRKKQDREASDPCWIYPDEYIEIKENTEVTVDRCGCRANFLSMTIMVTSPVTGSYTTSKHDRCAGLGFTPCRFMKYKSNKSAK
ncbi:hypothetical protein CBR_g22232 [Chara braunii]|uniref:Uncharacterized protein n=1 Tax=Chara braunii TaxID=69332 RepID=A0A388L2D1_CHABU|nr:hypothetical protein CBR_g22232 [Chara braunii]|eukprot:GBG76484.1 hypothetical protein CBR_g22232 [Chara braunii]